MARVISTAFCVALLAATAAAFAVTEGAKTELSPIFHTLRLVGTFSPHCGCDTRAAQFSFKLRKREHIRVWMERDGKRADTLVSGRTYAPGTVTLSFDGIVNGDVLPDGSYTPVVQLPHRTFKLPSTFELDTHAPSVVSAKASGRFLSFHVKYVLSEKAHAALLVDGTQVELTRFESAEGTLAWSGLLDGKPAKAGAHTLEVVAVDTAGNRSAPSRPMTVDLQHLALARSRIVVRPRERFGVGVISRSTTFAWRLNGGHGVQHGATLRLRAPKQPGTYHLYVTADGSAAKAVVVVHG